MNLFNRIVISLLLVFNIFFWIVLAVWVTYYPMLPPRLGRRLAESGRDFFGLLSEAQRFEPFFLAVVVIMGLVSIVVSLFLLWLEMVPREAGGVRLVKVSGGTAMLTTQAISQRVAYELAQVPELGQARAQVDSRGRQVDVRLELRTSPEGDISARAEEACRIVRDTIENIMGVKLRNLSLRIQAEPLARSGAAPLVPAPPASEPARPLYVSPPSESEGSRQ